MMLRMRGLDPVGVSAAAKALAAEAVGVGLDTHDKEYRGAAEVAIRAYLAVAGSPTAENPYRTLHARMSPPGAAWDEGFAAGRAAATPDHRCTVCRDVGAAYCGECAHLVMPDPPTDAYRPWPIAPGTVMPPRRQPIRWGSRADDPPTEIHDDPQRTKAYLAGLAAGRTEAAAASPDERLREALELIRAHARLDLTERGIAEAERYARIADDALTARDLLASSTAEKLAPARKRSATASDPMPLCDCELCARPLRDHDEEETR